MLLLCLLYIISILTQHNQNIDGTVKVSDHCSYAFQCCAIYVYRSFSLSRHKKKINSKPFNEKSQEHENVVEDQYISNLSRSHVCLIHRF